MTFPDQIFTVSQLEQLLDILKFTWFPPQDAFFKNVPLSDSSLFYWSFTEYFFSLELFSGDINFLFSLRRTLWPSRKNMLYLKSTTLMFFSDWSLCGAILSILFSPSERLVSRLSHIWKRVIISSDSKWWPFGLLFEVLPPVQFLIE